MIRRLLAASALAAAFTLGAGGSAAFAATTQQTFLTFYGWYDNTPPGGDIAYPQIHSTAGGKGTFADPITFATSSAELSPGTKVWVPRVGKYFIMEDSCQECQDDWSTQGPNGGPGLRHIDLWIGGQGGSAFNAIDCEDALTHYNDDGTPVLEPVVVNPPSDEPVDSTPLFNTTTGECYGGAQPNVTVGQYRNVSSGQCLADPNNSSTSGTALATAACSGDTAQQFTFHGAFLVKNNLCANNSSGTIKLTSCTGGPSQQWSINPNGTISDIQTGQKCFRVSGTSVIAGSCSGSASQWTFIAANSNTTRYEAETATISQGVVATNHLNFSGTGFVDYNNVTGSYVEWSVAAGGSVSIRYANGTTTNRPMNINGTVVDFPGTGSWDTWATKTLTVNATTIRATATTSNGGPNVDYIDVTPVRTVTRYEAENATISQGVLETTHTGSSGTGYVNCDNVIGSYVQFAVNTATAGSASVRIRYSNGTTTNRPADIAVNGATVASGQAFNPTTNWDTWADVTLTLSLTAGANTIRITGTTSNGPANLDYIEIS